MWCAAFKNLKWCFNFFKGFIPQILLDRFLNAFTYMLINKTELTCSWLNTSDIKQFNGKEERVYLQCTVVAKTLHKKVKELLWTFGHAIFEYLFFKFWKFMKRICTCLCIFLRLFSFLITHRASSFPLCITLRKFSLHFVYIFRWAWNLSSKF